jgi:N-acetyl-anhydromuramyl-L-alanine amidase AmpD
LPAPAEDELRPAPSASPGPALSPPVGPTGEPPLQGPSASYNNTTRRRAATPRAALRAKVKPFVNDPDDLFVPPKADRPWRFIVLHHSAHHSGSYAQIDREHRQALGWDGCGYHFVIGNGSQSPDGQIEVTQRWVEQKPGAHCRNGKTPDINDYGVGICLVGNFDDAPPTPRQIEASRALVAYLSERYAIPREQIGTHNVLASGPTVCPGKNFPVTAILGMRNLAAN